MSEEEKKKHILDYLLSEQYGRIPHPRATKLRTITEVPVDAIKFYDSVGDAIINHIYDMNEKLGAWEILGATYLNPRLRVISALESKEKQLDTEPAKDEPNPPAKPPISGLKVSAATKIITSPTLKYPPIPFGI